MNPYQKYRQPDAAAGWLRIDVTLALFDGAIDRLDRALVAWRAGDAAVAGPQVVKAQLIVGQLASGVIVEANPELGTNYLRLYEYCLHELTRGDLNATAGVRTVLATLREGFESIREEARHLERSGSIPPIDHQRIVYASA